MEKKNKSLFAILAVTVLVLVIGGSYAFITFVLEGKKENTIIGGSLTVTLDDISESLGNGTGDIELTDQFPVSDAAGKTKTPYTFTLSNTSAKAASYTIYLDEEAVTGTRMSDSQVKVYLTNGDGSIIYKDVTKVSDLGAKISRTVEGETVNSSVLYSGVLNPSDTMTFVLRLFIASDADETIMGKQYATKVSVDAVQVPEYAVVVVNGTETKSTAVFQGATANLEITPGTGTGTIACTNGMTGTITASTVTVTNVTAHTVCTVTYSE